MDLRLTEIMCCPRCGPPHGLVLLADALEERRVLEGVLGCPSCGARYPVRAGFAELRPPENRPGAVAAAGPDAAKAEGRSALAGEPAGAGGEGERRAPGPAGPGNPATADAPSAAAAPFAPPAAGGDDVALRLAALIGMGGGGISRFSLVVGPGARAAPAMAALVPDAEVIAAGADLVRERESAGVSRIAVGGALPFFDASLRGVALTGPAAGTLLEEAIRVLDPLGRLLLEPAPPDAGERLVRVGARVVAQEGGSIVAVRG